MQDIRLTAMLMACLTLFPSSATAFWRLPCRGRSGTARLDPIVDPGKVSGHTHVVHGSGSFGMSSDQASLQESDCTSCAVTQDKSAYWTPALYFMHTNGSAEMVEEVGGMLAYYLLYGENITAFPQNFRMLAGDPFQRNFTWPVPDPPKSAWTGAQASQAALRQKALGFNCLNYQGTAEASLNRHFLPNKTYLDEHCTDGVRFELMFPSCWNGKDTDSDDHASHVAYPSLVMDGTCPEGYETRLVSLFYETIWNTYAFKDVDGYFALANGDPTGYGYHGDFMQAWDEGVLQEAIETCTSETGIVDECEIFDIQTQDKQQQCEFEMPSALKHENVFMHPEGLPGGMTIEWGPAYAMMDMGSGNSGHSGHHSGHHSSPTTTAPGLIPTLSLPAIPTLSLGGGISIDTGNLLDNLHAVNTAADTETTTAAPTTTFTSTSTPSPTPTPVTSTIIDPITEEIVYLQRDIVVLVDGQGTPISTSTGSARTVSSATTTVTETSTSVSYVKKDTVPEPVEEEKHSRHARRHLHHRHGHTHNNI
ncbi:unnamed protein product [Penicillium salamii]|uniref:DUF1996 domain-containing protein n=1 Tax=Penicillium salamii TaxID=1612424 RepID=A0A9W4JS69_9EURO|nr:unnamed protein product [Penicillium salamii]CAG8332505.1 unnamed protein product [Penicillium salamii]CAG8411323.1 unnamed protein product [Penicillium salamii]